MGFWDIVEGAAKEISGTQNGKIIADGLLVKTRYAAHKEIEDVWARSMSDTEWRGLLRMLDAAARDSGDRARADFAYDLIRYCKSLR